MANLNFLLLKRYELGFKLMKNNESLPREIFSPAETIALDLGRRDAVENKMSSKKTALEKICAEYKSEQVIISCNAQELQQWLETLPLNYYKQARYAYKHSEFNAILWEAELLNCKKDLLDIFKAIGKIHPVKDAQGVVLI